MVFNEHVNTIWTRHNAYLTAPLTPSQLDSIQSAFAKGAFWDHPDIRDELFIKSKPEYRDKSHAEIRGLEKSGDPVIIIDHKTPEDGGIWYIKGFATDREVENGLAESTDVLWKIRMRVEDLVIMDANYSCSNIVIQESLHETGLCEPFKVDYVQPKLFIGTLKFEGPFTKTIWVTAEPGEFEETANAHAEPNDVYRKLYRIKPGIAKSHGLLSQWALGVEPQPVTLPDGTVKTFPKESARIISNFDPECAWNCYRRPEGSL